MSVSTRREREKQERRDCIVDTARAVFLERGLEQATMGEIARAAELSKGALYLHFESKDELCMEVLQLAVGSMVEVATVAVQAAPDGLSAVRALLEAHYSHALNEPAFFRLATAWMVKRTPVDLTCPAAGSFRERISGMRALLLDSFARGKADGSIRSDIEAPMGLSVMAGLFGNELFFFSHRNHDTQPPGVDIEVLVPRYIDLITRALAAHPESFQEA